MLATAWEPFYSSSSSFSEHSTASIVSLQGKNPLPGHPKTLRDLTHISEMLTLPSAFGNIQLGETFSSCLSVNNETTNEVEGVSLRVEMQTATTKTILSEDGGPDFRLAAGDTLEKVVEHEIKELGQHVLACTVSYRQPSSRSAHDTNTPAVQSFRKFYKFSVSHSCIYVYGAKYVPSIGHQSPICKDESTHSSFTFCVTLSR
jgi:trafficking protein particle complex subunit 13